MAIKAPVGRTAVGDEEYVAETKRKIILNNSVYELRKPLFPYGTHFDTKNNALRLGNTFLWNINSYISDT